MKKVIFWLKNVFKKLAGEPSEFIHTSNKKEEHVYVLNIKNLTNSFEEIEIFGRHTRGKTINFGIRSGISITRMDCQDHYHTNYQMFSSIESQQPKITLIRLFSDTQKNVNQMVLILRATSTFFNGNSQTSDALYLNITPDQYQRNITQSKCNFILDGYTSIVLGVEPKSEINLILLAE